MSKTYNYLKQCPICNQKNIELEEYGSLKHICTCSHCKSKFKLVSDEWYYPNFPEPIGDETKVILLSNKTEERFFVIEDYEYQGFGIKESTGEFYGKLYDSYEPYRLITTMTNINLDNLKTILEDHIYKLIDNEKGS